ncbi:MAG: NAD+ synthase, partial [Armatimonadetes bacterium]|nr:NAD+ synthase [Armatimonadota bacterium]
AAEDVICRFLRDEIRRAGFLRGVLGLSGGVDSSVVAALAARALGPENVLGVLMPYKTSSPDSLEDATAIAKQLGIKTMRVDITPQIDAYFGQFPDADARRRGNKMARERMSILYDLSVVHEALVIGTSNKTEFLLGYFTLWGDMACALMPIADLYKTQVRQMAQHLGIPQHIVSKAPSADLWQGQTDEGELGFTYAEADRILYRIVDLGYPPERCVEEGFDRRTVEAVLARMRATEYKRRMPLVCKISAAAADRAPREP